MKLVTFESAPGGTRIGAVRPDGDIVDLTAAYALFARDVEREQACERLAAARVPPDMRKLFEGGDASLKAAAAAFQHAAGLAPGATGANGELVVYPTAQARIKAPIIPKKFFHTAGNFREHHEEAQKSGFSHPVLPWIIFFQNVDAIIGPDEAIVYPSHLTQELDYELELAIIIKKSGKHFSAAEAADYIGGFVIFNDVTARDIQREEMKSGVFSLSKGIDTFCPLGPWIVTPDEMPDPHHLSMRLRVNGQLRQSSNSSRMAVTIPEIIAHYSPMGYSAGDVVSTGTVSGVAAFSADPKSLYLKPGDVVECEIEGIGVLRNPVISWEQAH
ncbi:MAG TPA: fumarylacetoacetate hydrolase family protein, partial [Candidatus Acidoferrales bacterium]|nr:fumarylacetoacetate hydrolase family protein [Candidatus Acidoferrales bacterium]